MSDIYFVYREEGEIQPQRFNSLHDAEKEVVRLQNIKGYAGVTFHILSSLGEWKPKEEEPVIEKKWMRLYEAIDKAGEGGKIRRWNWGDFHFDNHSEPWVLIVKYDKNELVLPNNRLYQITIESLIQNDWEVVEPTLEEEK